MKDCWAGRPARSQQSRRNGTEPWRYETKTNSNDYWL